MSDAGSAKSDVGSADSELRLLRARAFLYGRQAALYGSRSLVFSLEKSYRGFDDMLKRSILYARFAVREVVAEVRAEIDRDSASLVVHRPAGLTPAKGGAPGFEDFVRSKRLIPAPGAPRKRADLAGRAHEVDILRVSPDHLELKLLPLEASKRKGYRASGRSLREAWIRALLAEWIGAGSPLRLEGGPSPLSRTGSFAWTVSRRISQVDIDISGEASPHVFRWKEVTMAEASAYAALDEADIAAALAASGVALPPDAHRQGMVQEELGRGSACLLLRYAHLIPDPGPDLDAGPDSQPPLMNAGFIVMENDYLEICIDARTGKVFSEAWKWRPAPAVASGARSPEPAAAVRG